MSQRADTDSVLDLFDSTTDEPTPAPAGPGGGGPSPALPVDDRRRRRRKILAWLLAVLMLLVGALVAWYLLTRKPISQLPGTNFVAMPTYKTAFYGIEQPLGVAETPDGSTLFATHGGAKAGVTMFDRDGRTVRELDLPTEPAMHVPVYLTIAPNGNLYVGDRAAGQVYIYAPNGDYIERFIPQDDTVTFSPLGVAVAQDGTLYLADVSSDKPADHRILVFDPNGKLTHTWGQGELNYPNQMLLDGGGLYVTDSNNGRLLVFDAEGQRSTLLATGAGAGDLGLPRGVGIDDRGRVFVADTTDHMVRMYTRGAQLTDHPEFVGSMGDQGMGDGEFNFPNGLDVDARARIYIADRENNRIQVWGF